MSFVHRKDACLERTRRQTSRGFCWVNWDQIEPSRYVLLVLIHMTAIPYSFMALFQRALAEIKYLTRIYFCNPMEIIVLLIGMTASTKSPCPFEINNLPLLRPTRGYHQRPPRSFCPDAHQKKNPCGLPESTSSREISLRSPNRNLIAFLEINVFQAFFTTIKHLFALPKFNSPSNLCAGPELSLLAENQRFLGFLSLSFINIRQKSTITSLQDLFLWGLPFKGSARWGQD